MPVVRIFLRRVGAAAHGHAVGSWKRPEVVVESVVLLDDDDDVLGRGRGRHLKGPPRSHGAASEFVGFSYAPALLVGPFELHGPPVYLLCLPRADVADLAVGIVVPPGAGHRIRHRLTKLV